MILSVLELKEGVAQSVRKTYAPEKFNLDAVDLHYLGEIELDGTAERVGETVFFNGKLTRKIEKICARCVRALVESEQIPFDLSYETGHQEFIDTTDDLKDILFLEREERFLCRKDCKGLCPDCGADLNHEACRCQK